MVTTWIAVISYLLLLLWCNVGISQSEVVISDELTFAILSTLIVVIFAKAANSIKNLQGNIRFTKENPDYMLLDDFEMISRVVTSIGLKSTSKLPNMYFCSLIMMPILLLIGNIIPNL